MIVAMLYAGRTLIHIHEEHVHLT